MNNLENIKSWINKVYAKWNEGHEGGGKQERIIKLNDNPS